MTLEEIKAAVNRGDTVKWSNERYTVIKDKRGEFGIDCPHGSYIALTHVDGVTLNGKPDEFYIAKVKQ